MKFSRDKSDKDSHLFQQDTVQLRVGGEVGAKNGRQLFKILQINMPPPSMESQGIIKKVTQLLVLKDGNKASEGHLKKLTKQTSKPPEEHDVPGLTLSSRRLTPNPHRSMFKNVMSKLHSKMTQ